MSLPRLSSTSKTVSEGDPSEKREPPRTREWATYAFCIVLHILVVVGHAVLVAHAFDGHPVHLLKEDWLTVGFYYIVVIAPNAVGKGILVVVLYFTQKLALRRNLHVSQSLTSVHDKSAAWMGLGSATISVWNQLTGSVTKTKAEAEVTGATDATSQQYKYKHGFMQGLAVFAILLYLVGLFILGLTLPLLLNIGFVYDSNQRFDNITAVLPAIGNDSVALHNDYTIMSIVPLLDYDIITYGLHASIIYDVPNFGVGDQPIDVTSTEFHSTCKVLPEASFTTYNADNGTFTFQISPLVRPIQIMPSPRSINIAPLLLEDTTRPPPATMIVASTLEVIDDATQHSESFVQFSPSIVPMNCGSQEECGTLSQVQLFACDFSTTSLITQFDPVKLILTHPDLVETEIWQNWSLPDPVSNTILDNVHNFGEISPMSGLVQTYGIAETNNLWTRNLSLIENELMDALGYSDASTHLVALTDLEFAVERAVASVLWRAALTKVYSNAPRTDEFSPSRFVIKISRFAPTVGLGVSSILLLIAIFLCWQPLESSMAHPELDSSGVLQLTYLSAVHTNIPEDLIANLKGVSPEKSALREAGKKIQAWSLDSVGKQSRPSSQEV
ncbi:hypothetical protein BDW22DRAFT_1421685 [Trametopsis cervina]|nr:hypothetical protein BDW22DRAFT_1421685 [Trametopsis cervina]